jgi:hypothetical protein
VPGTEWYHGGDLMGGHPAGTFLYVTDSRKSAEGQRDVIRFKACRTDVDRLGNKKSGR